MQNIVNFRLGMNRRMRSATRLACAAGVSLMAITALGHAQSFGTAFFAARISQTGVVVQGIGVASAKLTAVGSYQVTFTRSLSSCYINVAVLGTGPSFANTNVSVGTPTLLFVRTYNGTGVATSAPFNLARS